MDFTDRLVSVGIPQSTLFEYKIGFKAEIKQKALFKQPINKVWHMQSNYAVIDLLDRYQTVVLNLESMTLQKHPSVYQDCQTLEFS